MAKPTLMACLLALLLQPVSGIAQSPTVEVTFGGFCAVTHSGQRLVLPRFAADSKDHKGHTIKRHRPYVVVVTGQTVASKPPEGAPDGHQAWYLRPGKLTLDGVVDEPETQLGDLPQMTTLCPECGLGKYEAANSTFWDHTVGKLVVDRPVRFGYMEISSTGYTIKEPPVDHPTLLKLTAHLAGNSLTILSGNLKLVVSPVGGVVKLEIKSTPKMRTDGPAPAQWTAPTASQSVVPEPNTHFELFNKLDPKADHFPYVVPYVEMKVDKKRKPAPYMTGPDCVPPVQF